MQSTSFFLCLPLLLGVVGCNGEILDPSGDPGGGASGDIAESPRFPRLTNTQWQASVRDLLYLSELPVLASELQPDPPLGRFDNNIARLTFSAAHWRGFQRAAEEMAELATNSEEILGAITPPNLPTDAEGAGRAFIDHFAHRAFRRPLTDAEKDSYLALFLEGASHHPDLGEVNAGVRIVVEALLQSPHFLYRVEDSAAPDSKLVSLDGYEVASRLSYAFWNTMPSDELFAAADAGDLDREEGVREWAAQMFDDPRTEETFSSFHEQAFEMESYSDLDKSAELFPEWDREMGTSMKTESSLFLGGEVFGGGGIRELLTSSRAYVDAEMAALYGIEGDFGSEFVPVDLDPEQRSGMLTRLGFLSQNATLTQSDPIHRGVFVNLNLICRTLAEIPELPEILEPVGETNRERINSITGPGTCGEGCHATLINPIGFALEHYDALGQYREQESGLPVNAADSYFFADGRAIEFNNALELSEQLAESPEVHACYIQHLLEYLLGRDLAEQDMELVQAFAQESLDEGISIREIVLRVVESRDFRYRVSQGGGQ